MFDEIFCFCISACAGVMVSHFYCFYEILQRPSSRINQLKFFDCCGFLDVNEVMKLSMHLNFVGQASSLGNF